MIVPVRTITTLRDREHHDPPPSHDLLVSQQKRCSCNFILLSLASLSPPPSASLVEGFVVARIVPHILVLFLQLRLSKRHVRGREEREEGAHLTSLTDIHDACALYLRELPGQLIDSPARGEDGLVGDWDLCHRGVVFVIAIGGGVDADTSLKALQIVRIEMIKKLDEWIVGRRGGGCSRGEDAIDNLSDCGASAGKRSGVWKIGRES
jgi:hypothetical protein